MCKVKRQRCNNKIDGTGFVYYLNCGQTFADQRNRLIYLSSFMTFLFFTVGISWLRCFLQPLSFTGCFSSVIFLLFIHNSSYFMHAIFHYVNLLFCGFHSNSILRFLLNNPFYLFNFSQQWFFHFFRDLQYFILFVCFSLTITFYIFSVLILFLLLCFLFFTTFTIHSSFLIF